MRLTLVAAVAQDRTLGSGGRIPWHIPGDQARFRDLTWGRPVLMGRKTWESLPAKPLPGRENVVLSRDSSFAPRGARLAHSLEEALGPYAEQEGDVFVIGGADLFAQTLPLAARLVLTEVPGRFGGDAVFPPIPADFEIVSRQEHPGPPPCAVVVLERPAPRVLFRGRRR
ncbi:MAG: dihydrofolate reductase [Acidobacteriota bacterium]